MHLVDQLATQTEGAEYHIYTSRFYTSPTLTVKLLEEGMHTTGTVQKSCKGLPEDLKRLRLNNHETKVYRHSRKMLMALGWHDKRTVLMLSTWHNTDVKAISRVIKGKQQEDVEKPLVIYDNTEHMGAVDRSDHYCTSYSFTRKTLKWWRKLFFWLLKVCFVNSFILYKQATHAASFRQLTYRQRLVEQLVGNVRNKRSKKGAGQAPSIWKKD